MFRELIGRSPYVDRQSALAELPNLTATSQTPLDLESRLMCRGGSCAADRGQTRLAIAVDERSFIRQCGH